LAPVASPAAERGVGKGGKAGEPGGGRDDAQECTTRDAVSLPCGACGLPGGAAVTAGGASDLACAAATTG